MKKESYGSVLHQITNWPIVCTMSLDLVNTFQIYSAIIPTIEYKISQNWKQAPFCPNLAVYVSSSYYKIICTK